MDLKVNLSYREVQIIVKLVQDNIDLYDDPQETISDGQNDVSKEELINLYEKLKNPIS